MNLFTQTISITGYAIETVGVIIIVIGAIRAAILAVSQRSEKSRDELYKKDIVPSMFMACY